MAAYYVWSGATGSANGTTWANAYTTLTTAFSGKAAGDIFYVAHDHAESAAGITLTATGSTIATPNKVICVNRAGSVPPVSADRRATATVTSTSANNITLTGFIHYDGIIFSAGSGASGTAFLILGTAANHWLRFDNCSLRLGITITGSLIAVGGSSTALGGICVELNNTTVQFGHVGHTVQVVDILRWKNTPSAIFGTAPTVLFTPAASHGGLIECIGVDLSAAGSGKTLCVAATSTSQAFTYRFVDCKLDAAVTKADGAPVSYGTCDIDFVRSGATGVSYNVHRQRASGLLTEETTIVRTGGATG